MRNPFTGVRGRVTFTVLAVTAILYSLLASIGFVSIANSGRDAIRERIGEVLDQLESGVRSGTGAVTMSTTDGVRARLVLPQDVPPTAPGTITVVRTVEIDRAEVALVGTSSQARLTDSLRSLYHGLWIAIPLAAIVSALMAGMATSRALRPVGAITALADTIDASMEGARVPEPDTGDEVQHLASTVNEMLGRIDAGRVVQRQFTSDAAHELRTPLMALQGELELVASHAQPADDQFVTRLQALAARLGERIDDLVLLSTLDERRPLQPQHTCLLDLARAAAEEVAPQATVDGDRTGVLADATLVTRAARNLLANARRHAAAVVEVTVEHRDDRVWVHVDDDGPGIAAADVDRVFGRFTRLDEARGRDRGGAGLGLAIVASVATAHGGGVAVEGHGPLGGARLSFWLPA